LTGHFDFIKQRGLAVQDATMVSILRFVRNRMMHSANAPPEILAAPEIASLLDAYEPIMACGGQMATHGNGPEKLD
jgi:hypothetical protein